MNANELQHKTLVNLAWRFFERIGAQGMSFVVSILLARILSPSDYGEIALVMVFINILSVFINSGLGSAIVQKKNPDDLDYSTVFYFNMAVCAVLYLVIFVSAPYVAGFYHNEHLTGVLRAMGILLLISGLVTMQQTYVTKNMMFKKFFYSTLIGTALGGLAGVAAAFSGLGLWALVIQALVKEISDSVVLWFTVKWRPIWAFSFERLKGLFSYGWKLLVSQLIDTGYNNIRQLIIGKLYTSASLGFYNRGEQMPNLIVTNVNASIDSVLFPAISSVQDDQNAVKEMTRRAIRVSSYVMMPLMIGLLVCAKPLVLLLFTEKWLPCVPYLQVFCLIYMFYPIHTANLQAIKAVGRSDIFLKLEIVKKILGLAVLVIFLYQGAFALALSLLITAVLSTVINAYPNQKLLKYSYLHQLRDILPSLLLSLGMGACVFGLGFLPLPPALLLLVQVPAGALLYWGLSVWTKSEDYRYILNILQKMLKARKAQN